MGVRGENIGTAYVRILADGGGFDKSVRDQMDDVDWDKFGRKASDEWIKGWEEEGKKSANQKSLREAISKPLARGDWLTQTFFRGRNWSRFRGGLVREFGEAGERAADNLETSLLEGMTFDGLRNKLDNLIPDIVRAQKQLDAELAAVEKEANAQSERRLNLWFKDQLQGWERYNQSIIDLNRDRDKDLEAHWKALADAAEKQAERELKARLDMDRDLEDHWKHLADLADAYTEAEREAWRRADEDFERHVRDRQSEAGRLEAVWENLRMSIERMSRGMEKGYAPRQQMMDDMESLLHTFDRLNISTEKFEREWEDMYVKLRKSHPTIDRTNHLIHTLADRAGTAFGRGSRNNFINFMGSLARGMINLLSVIPSLVGWFAELGRTAKYAFDESMRNSGSVFRASMAAVIASLETGGAALAGFAALAAGAVILIGPLVAIMSMLAGVVTALAGSIAYALVGAIGAIAAVMMPAAAAVAVGAGAFLALDDAQKKVLKNDFKPVVDEFKELGKVAGKGIFDRMGRQAERLVPIIRGLRGTFRGVGDAIGDVNDSFLKSMEGEGFRAFRDEFEKFLPDAVRQLGDIVRNTLGGFGGILRGMIPFMERTLDWLDKITTRFNEWANSKKGQESIKKFFEDAGDSAAALGDFLESVWDFLWKIFELGRGSGDNIFESMAGGIEKATVWLSDPKNQEAIKQWFADAEELARNIGGIVRGINEVIDAFDNAETRIAGNFLVTGLAVSFQALGGAIRGAGWGIRTFADGIVMAVEGIWDYLQRLWGWIGPNGRLFTWADDVDWGGMFAGFGEALNGATTAATRFTDRVVGFFRGLPGRAVMALRGLPGHIAELFGRLPAPVQRVIGRIGGFFQGLPGRIASAIVSIPGRVQSLFNRLPGIIAGVIGRVVGHFTGLPGRAIGAIVSIPSRFNGVINGLPGMAASIIGRIVGFFQNLPERIGSAIAGIAGIVQRNFNAAVDAVAGIPGQIVGFFTGLGGRILSAIGTIDIGSLVHGTIDPPGPLGPWTFASGGIVNSLTPAIVGEAGPEAIVPLNRPLDQVDPAVRWLSAIAQGKPQQFSNGGVVGGGRTVNVEQHIYAPANDPRAVAAETVNRLVAVGY